MDVDELLQKAWKAVEKSGVPESLQAVAFKEAVDFLRNEEPAPAIRSKNGANGANGSDEPLPPDTKAKSTVDAKTFFARLTKESGVPEKDLRDILLLTPQGAVQVTPPTKDLGGSVSEQAKTVIALVASARAYGLGEDPVDAEAVRAEAERKRCYQPNNFTHQHLAAMKGFNAANRNEIVLTSKWVDDFKAAVDRVLKRTPAAKAS